MTATLERDATSQKPVQGLIHVPSSGRLRTNIVRNRVDWILVVILAIGAAVTRIWNLGGQRLFTDENVYVSQGWAVQNFLGMANYTYWYDHPFLGWSQLAGWFGLTGSLERHRDLTTMAGREYMVLMAVVTTVLIYVLARRLRVNGDDGIRRGFAFLAAALFVLSPLAVSFSRYVLLDNIAVPWVLAAMVLVLSPTRRLSAAIAGGACMGVAVLSKETAILIVPAYLGLLLHNYWQSGTLSRLRLRKSTAEARQDLNLLRVNGTLAVILSLGFFATTVMIYPMYAILKGELIPGPGHVSLIQGQILFQLFNREGSGNILQEGSNARLLVENAWLGLDPWLPLAGVVALMPALLNKRLRWGPALALGIQVGLLVTRDGYMPYPQIIMLLPFMALVVGGVLNSVWPDRAALQGDWRRKMPALLGAVAILALAYPAVTQVAYDWRYKLEYIYVEDGTSNQRAALDWAEANLDKYARLVTEGELWLDVRYRGFVNPQVVWVYKLDSDPAVQQEFGDLSGLDYLVLNKATIDAASGEYPTLQQAIDSSEVIQTFGPDGPNQVRILRVTPVA